MRVSVIPETKVFRGCDLSDTLMPPAYSILLLSFSLPSPAPVLFLCYRDNGQTQAEKVAAL